MYGFLICLWQTAGSVSLFDSDFGIGFTIIVLDLYIPTFHAIVIPKQYLTSQRLWVLSQNTIPFFISLSLSLSLSKSLRIFGMSLWVGVVIEAVEKVGGWYGDFRWVWQWKFWRMKRDRERERERGKRWWIYAARRFLSFTMFGSWIFLQAFSSVFQRFPIPEIRKQP